MVIISAPNGARRTREDHPALPVTPGQIAAAAEELVAAGTAVLHLHVRDASGRHSLDADIYRAAIAAIRAAVGDRLVIQVTTEAVGMYSREAQMAVVRDLRPEAVSLALRELCPDEASEAEAGRFYAFLARERIWPQHILYTPAEVLRFDRLRRNGVFADDHPWCLFVLGRYGDQAAGDRAQLDAMLGAADCSAFHWAVCCFGPWEHEAALLAARQGGHVRLGFENNLLRADGTLANSNAEPLADFMAARRDDRQVVTAGQLRHYLADR
ncbi:MAG: 3-keto-5-aminohexanoate cleavage protein [Xanthomonadales bacterium]|nr:3-keto-5-aminohexanoate cleavage protein [Xanthomonadales bacterium]